MRAALQIDDRKIETQEVPAPKPGPGQVLIKVAWASICGTDLHIYLGEFKERVKYPAILGHEFAGVVHEVGEGAKGFEPGDRVVADPIVWCGRCTACITGHNNACESLKLIGIEYDGAFAEYAAVDQNMVFRVPDGIDLRDAALTELYALGVHSTRRARIEPGDKVVILGAGRLGLAVLELVRQSAASWCACVDVLDSRLKIASRIGADLCINSRFKDPIQTVLDTVGPVDRVIECIGTAEEIPGRELPPQQAVSMCRGGGRVVIMGLGGQKSPVFWRQVALKELEIVGSRVTMGDFPRALELMSQKLFHPELLISKQFDLGNTGEAFALLEENPADYIKVLISVSGQD